MQDKVEKALELIGLMVRTVGDEADFAALALLREELERLTRRDQISDCLIEQLKARAEKTEAVLEQKEARIKTLLQDNASLQATLADAEEEVAGLKGNVATCELALEKAEAMLKDYTNSHCMCGECMEIRAALSCREKEGR